MHSLLVYYFVYEEVSLPLYRLQLADVKKVWSLHESLRTVNLNDASTSTLQGLLSQTYMAPIFLKGDEVLWKNILKFVLDLIK